MTKWMASAIVFILSLDRLTAVRGRSGEFFITVIGDGGEDCTSDDRSD